ncbi:MAG: response regulator [candidate division Zixibacteria bacterium]|nr:response regulator [candidate division Zixibacteria bacterium]MBU1469785.1 response regulator [candidate division Zixibacteria bacterium]
MIEHQIVDILLVEDNPCDAELTQRALKECNASAIVGVVTNGGEALDFLLAQGAFSHRDVVENPRVIFLDLKMPRVGGLECLRKIRTTEQISSVPVVILSSSAEEYDVMESYGLGANSYIVKPVDHDDFFETVVNVGNYWLSMNRVPSLAALPTADR